MLYKITCPMLITVEPKIVVETLLCPKFIVFDLCSHVSVRGNGWSYYLEFLLGYRG